MSVILQNENALPSSNFAKSSRDGCESVFSYLRSFHCHRPMSSASCCVTRARQTPGEVYDLGHTPLTSELQAVLEAKRLVRIKREYMLFRWRKAASHSLDGVARHLRIANGGYGVSRQVPRGCCSTRGIGDADMPKKVEQRLVQGRRGMLRRRQRRIRPRSMRTLAFACIWQQARHQTCS